MLLMHFLEHIRCNNHLEKAEQEFAYQRRRVLDALPNAGDQPDQLFAILTNLHFL